MENLIEVVFEDIEKGRVLRLLRLLITHLEGVISAECSERICIFKGGNFSEDGLNQFLDFASDVLVMIKIRSVCMKSICLPNVQLRILKYEGKYDIQFNFDFNELENTSVTILMDELHAYTKYLAFESGVRDFYCGMEPAADEDTRYFTNNELGPLLAS